MTRSLPQTRLNYSPQLPKQYSFESSDDLAPASPFPLCATLMQVLKSIGSQFSNFTQLVLGTPMFQHRDSRASLKDETLL